MARVPESETPLRKSKFTTFSYVRKYDATKYKEGKGGLVDKMVPNSCTLTQFHAIFTFPDNITVISLVN